MTFSDNYRYSPLILHQNLAVSSFWKISCNMESEMSLWWPWSQQKLVGARTLREESHLSLVGLWCREGGARPCCLFLSVLLPLGPRHCTVVGVGGFWSEDYQGGSQGPRNHQGAHGEEELKKVTLRNCLWIRGPRSDVHIHGSDPN